MQVYSFNQPSDLDHELVNQVVPLLKEAVALRGAGYVVLSGGKTPVGFLQLLSQSELPWDKLTFCMADERCVSALDSARNERLVRDYLLQGNAKVAKLMSLYDEMNPEHLVTIQKQLANIPQFDVVILGMGEDGHTASLFPCSNELADALADNAPAVVFVNPKNAPHKRVSLSKSRLLNSRALFLHLVGSNKKAALEQAMIVNDPMIMPICAFMNHQHFLKVMYSPN